MLEVKSTGQRGCTMRLLDVAETATKPTRAPFQKHLLGVCTHRWQGSVWDANYPRPSLELLSAGNISFYRHPGDTFFGTRNWGNTQFPSYTLSLFRSRTAVCRMSVPFPFQRNRMETTWTFRNDERQTKTAVVSHVALYQ